MKYIFSLLFIFVYHLVGAQILAPVPTKPIVSMAAPVNQPVSDKSLEFIENKNQWDKSVKFMAPLPNGNLFLQRTGFVYAFYANTSDSHNHGAAEPHTAAKPAKAKGHAYSVTFLGAKPEANSLAGENATPSYRNYFIGNNQAQWAAHVKSYRDITYSNLYPGINMHLYEEQAHLKYDFIVQPNTNPGIIKMQYKGADELYLEYGNLVIKTSVNEVKEQKPIAFQLIDGRKIPIACQFKLTNNVVSFEFPEGYDPSKELIIDPILVFSTFSGSRSDNWGFTATYDNDGNMYSGGIVRGTGFPATTGAFDTAWNGLALDDNGWDIGILKYNTQASGNASLVYATYIGGRNTEVPSSLIVNSKNELLLLGSTVLLIIPPQQAHTIKLLIAALPIYRP
jgi:hypothetical protein